jgi:hypothetical protein
MQGISAQKKFHKQKISSLIPDDDNVSPKSTIATDVSDPAQVITAAKDELPDDVIDALGLDKQKTVKEKIIRPKFEEYIPSHEQAELENLENLEDI